MKKYIVSLLILILSLPAFTQATAEASVKLNKITILEGMSYTLNLDSSSKSVSWTSSDETIVNVSSDGTVTALHAGNAIITAKVNKKKYTCKVTVNEVQVKEKENKTGVAMNNMNTSTTDNKPATTTGVKKEVLTIKVNITGSNEVKGKTGEVSMISFNATCDCELFKGKTLPGGVDTQKEWYGTTRTISARYILEGTDKAGKKCKLFIENNGVVKNNVFSTTPKILTDSEVLKFLETANLEGTLTFEPDCIIIHIFNVE